MSNLTKSGFNVSATNLQEAMQVATMISGSQLAPQAYKGRPEDTLVAMMMGNELGLNPIQAIQNIAVINGKPSIYGDAMLALVQNHPAFGGINESFDDETYTAICTIWRKGGEKHTQKFSRMDAESSSLWGKKGPWSQYPKRMLAMRSRGFALRNQFADALCGLISAEEAQDMPVERELNPVSNSPQIEQPKYISDKQAIELETLAGNSELITKIKTAYKINSLTELKQSEFEPCKVRITTFLERHHASN